jgi:hypothetical protein
MQHKSTAQDMAIEIVAHEEYRFAIGFLLGVSFGGSTGLGPAE